MKYLVSTSVLVAYVGTVSVLAGLPGPMARFAVLAFAMIPGTELVFWRTGLRSPAKPSAVTMLTAYFQRLGPWRLLAVLALLGGNALLLSTLQEADSPMAGTVVLTLALLPGIAFACVLWIWMAAREEMRRAAD